MLQRTTGHLAEVETRNINPPVIDRLIQEVALKATDNNFHRKTPSEIERVLNRKLTSTEKRAWSKHRQEFIRNEKKQIQISENEKRKNEALRKKELLTFGLLGHTNEKLCEKIIALEIAHTQKALQEDGTWREKKGRDSTRQLIRALALHTNEHINQIILQIQTFTPEQKKRAQAAIVTIEDYYNGIKTLERSKFLLTQLSDTDLRDEIISIFVAGAKYKWDNFLQGFLGHKLDDLGSSQIVMQLQKRIAGLSLSHAFTEEMREEVVQYINKYLTTPVKKSGGLQRYA
ncbi:hypothetical protein KA017_01155 [Candidatus Woesebacteria bacterium]|nr:hypothetical protein [Candidatus Woesebacteria bacterium]